MHSGYIDYIFYAFVENFSVFIQQVLFKEEKRNTDAEYKTWRNWLSSNFP